MTRRTVSVAEVRSLIEEITERLAEVAGQLAACEAERASLRAEGVFDKVPSASWETRNGKGRYLRLVFPSNGGARRRRYIGNKPERVTAALAKVGRTRRCLALGVEVHGFNYRLRRAYAALESALVRLTGAGW